MSRRGNIVKRQVLPDRLYNDHLLAKFINCLMWQGKKSVAERIVYTALSNAAQKLDTDSISVFHKAINNVKPVSECVSRRVGGTNFSVPRVVRDSRGISLAIRIIIAAARGMKGKPMSHRLEQELVNAYNGTGAACKKKEEMHKMSSANMSSAHFRW